MAIVEIQPFKISGPPAERRLISGHVYSVFLPHSKPVPGPSNDLPPLPAGYAFVVDADGSYLVDSDGSFLITESN